MSSGASDGDSASAAATTADLAEQIESALTAVTAELQAGDVVAAAAAVQSLVAMCQSTQGQQGLSSDQLARLRGLLERCTILASTTEVELNHAMQKFNQGGRARRAYRDV